MSLFQKFAALAATSATTALLLHASPANAQAYNGGVAEVSVANGNVSIVRGDSGAQAAATVNAPLVPGDYLSTGPGSTAEVQFDGASMLRVGSNSQVRLIDLSPGSREAQIGVGTVDLAELQGGGGAQIDTPSVAVRPNQNGDVRVSVNGNGQTAVTVRSGSATVSSGSGSQTLTPGSTLVASGPYSNPSINMQGAIGFDSFDQYNMSRDQAIASAYNSNPYLSPQLAGYSNLSNYGTWQNVPGYGEAWAPSNQSQNNFAPYQNGQWVWEPGSGYTWVDNAPYGYAVTHYGSWFNNQNYGGWLWQPPAYQDQSTSNALASAWLPAVVSFFLNGGSGVDLGSLLSGGFSALNGGNYGNNTDIGWIPLAPGEQYQPWYGTNYSYPATQLTSVPTVTNINNYYTNARYYRGVTMVPVNSWRTGDFRHYTSTRAQELRHVYLIRGSVPVVPTTANLHYTATRVSRPVTLSHVFTAPRFAAKAPAAHVSFATQQAHIRAISVAKPKVVPISELHRVTAHPVYHPVKRAEVHVTAMKPVAPKTTAPKAPAPKHETAPKAPAHSSTTTTSVTHPAPAPKPFEHTKPAPKPEAKPAAKPEAKPVQHPKPVTNENPVTHTAPAAKPVMHHETAPLARPEPAAKPITHTAPAAKPVVHQAPPAPAVHPAAEAKPVPHEAPVARPVTHPAPAVKPASHPEPAKTAPKTTEEKPAVHPTARPV